MPDYVDWNRWVGPAPMTAFHEAKLQRDNHENMSNFSLGMISCWGIHHLDIAQWGNGSGRHRPEHRGGHGRVSQGRRLRRHPELEGAVRVRQRHARGLCQRRHAGLSHGIRFVGDSGWVHVVRGDIKASDDKFLEAPQNKVGTMPIKLAISGDHTRNFLDAIKNSRPGDLRH